VTKLAASVARSLAGWRRQLNGLALGADLAHLREFLVGGVEADVQSVDLAQPTAILCFADAVVEVDDDRE
jgi:hypothetical protein